MGLIQALAFIECFAVNGNKVSISEPTPDDRAKSLHKEILACLVIIKKLPFGREFFNLITYNFTAK